MFKSSLQLLRKACRLPPSSDSLKMKEKHEISTSKVTFFSCRLELRVKLADAARWEGVERTSRMGEGEREREKARWGGYYWMFVLEDCLDWYAVSNWRQM